MTAKAIINGQSIELFATSKREATPSGDPVWVDDQGYVYCKVGEESTYPTPIIIDEPHATRLRIGQSLARLRIMRGVTIEQFAQMLDMKVSTVKNLEVGRFIQNADTLDTYAQKLGGHLEIVPND